MIVIDHHVAEPLLPRAVAVVNPNRLDESSPHGALAAVGVAFLLVVAVNRELRRAGWYGAGRTEPDLLQWLDLVALGTVCDVVPLAGVNRALVAQGTKVARRRDNPGLAALAAVAGIGEPIDTYHLGLCARPAGQCRRPGRRRRPRRAPARNRRSGGRRASWRGVSTPTTASAAISRRTPWRRRSRLVEASPQSPVLVFAAAENWHPGVIGIVAARLKERYERPACVVALADGIGRGSGRSVAGLPLGPAVIAARQAGLLINGGGHAMAAGFTVAAEKLGALESFLVERLGDGIDNEPLVPELRIDGTLSIAAAQSELIDHIARLAPFGAANPEPRFVFPCVRVLHAEAVGTSHLRCTLADPLDNARMRGIAFRAAGTPLGQFLAETRGIAIHLAGHLRRDSWRGGDAVQLAIDDAAPTTI